MDTPGEILDDDDTTKADSTEGTNGQQAKEGKGRAPSPPPPSANGVLGVDVRGRVSNRSNSEDRILRRAAREGWNVPAAEKPAVVARMIRIVEKGIDRDAVSAARALVSMESQDMDARGEGKTGGNTTYNTVNILAAGEEAAKQLALIQGQPLPPPPSVQGGNDNTQG